VLLLCPHLSKHPGLRIPDKSLYVWPYVIPMGQISIRDLQKISGETIGALPGPTPVKSGGRTIGLLVPLKAADPDRLGAVLTQAEALAKGRNPTADDGALAPFGEVDPVDWSVEAVRALRAAPARG
jgi:hypothetical protein